MATRELNKKQEIALFVMGLHRLINGIERKTTYHHQRVLARHLKYWFDLFKFRIDVRTLPFFEESYESVKRFARHSTDKEAWELMAYNLKRMRDSINRSPWNVGIKDEEWEPINDAIDRRAYENFEIGARLSLRRVPKRL